MWAPTRRAPGGRRRAARTRGAPGRRGARGPSVGRARRAGRAAHPRTGGRRPTDAKRGGGGRGAGRKRAKVTSPRVLRGGFAFSFPFFFFRILKRFRIFFYLFLFFSSGCGARKRRRRQRPGAERGGRGSHRSIYTRPPRALLVEGRLATWAQSCPPTRPGGPRRGGHARATRRGRATPQRPLARGGPPKLVVAGDPQGPFL